MNERTLRDGYQKHEIQNFKTPLSIWIAISCCVYDKIANNISGSTVNCCTANYSWQTHQIGQSQNSRARKNVAAQLQRTGKCQYTNGCAKSFIWLKSKNEEVIFFIVIRKCLRSSIWLRGNSIMLHWVGSGWIYIHCHVPTSFCQL